MGTMFPGPHAVIYRNEAGEPIGWDDAPYEPDPYDEYDDAAFADVPDEDDEDDPEPTELAAAEDEIARLRRRLREQDVALDERTRRVDDLERELSRKEDAVTALTDELEVVRAAAERWHRTADHWEAT